MKKPKASQPDLELEGETEAPAPPDNTLYSMERPDLFGPDEGRPFIEVMCVNCYRPIQTRDPRQDVCDECYYWITDQMAEMQVQQSKQAVHPLFHVP